MNPADEAVTLDQLTEMFSGSIRVHDDVDYYLNGNIDRRIAAILEADEIFVTDVYREGQADEESDIRILAKARIMACVLVTADRDFREIHERIIVTTGLSHAGIFFVKSDTLKSDPTKLAALLIRMAQKYQGSTNLLQNQLFKL